MRVQAFAYSFIALGYFLTWSYLRPLETSRYQHIAAYAGGIIAIIFALDSFFPDFNLYARLLVAYIGLIFALLYAFEGNK